jgi:hypothetical protein
MWGALSDEMMGLSFARVTVSSSKSFAVCIIYILHVIKHGDEPSGSIKCWEVLEWMHNWRLLKKGSAP